MQISAFDAENFGGFCDVLCGCVESGADERVFGDVSECAQAHGARGDGGESLHGVVVVVGVDGGGF